MQVRQFTVRNIREAIAAVKAELGPDAVILSIRTVKDKNGKNALEVTASNEPAPAVKTDDTSAGPAIPSGLLREDGDDYADAATRPQNLNRVLSELQVITRRLEDIQRHFDPHTMAERLDGVATSLAALQQAVAEGVDAPRLPGLADQSLSPLYQRLLEAGVHDRYARELIDATSRRLSSKALSPQIYGLEYLASVVMEKVRTVTPLAPGKERQVHMFIGPTGVGKTTTIAKLAAQHVFEFNRSVAFLTIDTFRVGAIDQLRTYARILDVPLEVCLSEVELIEAARRHVDKHTLFIDTAGASQKDARMMGELAKMHQAGVPMDVHLIVEATTSEADLVDIAARYSALPLTSLVISKLDEANNFGNVYNLMQTTRLPFSYFTVGQNVPEDIELATPERVADLLLDVTAYA
jgi:flagellar biosynthesis protein FlhF